MNLNALEPEMFEAVERVARFMETLDDTALEGVFAETDVTIIENFAPHIFSGADAVQAWARGFRKHAEGLSGLKHAFGTPQDFSAQGGLAFFTLPTIWTGTGNGAAFSEQGGWAFVLIRQNGRWRIKGYGWAVTSVSREYAAS